MAPGVVGRTAEVAMLQRATDSLHRAEAVVLVGEAGIGKSAVLHASVAVERLCLGRCLPPVSAALAPIATIVADLLGRGANPSHPALGAYAGALRTLVPSSAHESDLLRDGAHPVVMGDALLRLWTTIPVPQRPVLAIEDIHWADQESVAVIHRMIERASAVGVALIVTSRPKGEGLAGLRRLVSDRIATELVLKELEPAAVKDMAAACLGVGVDELPDTLSDHLAAAGGVPLHVEAVLGDLSATGLLRKDDERWHLDAPREVPATIERLAVGRLLALSTEHRQVIELASLMVGRIDVDLVATAAASTSRLATEALRAATRQGLTEVDRRTGQFWFRHELFREAVFGTLVASERRQHATALLAALGPRTTPSTVDDLALIAALTTWAHGPQQAAADYLSLAQLHLDHSAPLSAGAAAETALRTGSPSVRTEARALLVEASALAGNVDTALDHAARLHTEIDAGTAILTADRFGRVTEAVIRAFTQRGDWVRADELLHDIAADPPPSTVALASLVALEVGHFEEAGARARNVLDQGAAGAAACQAMEVLGRLARRSDLDVAHGWFARAEAVAHGDGLHLWRARALHELATISQLRSLDVVAHYQARQAAIDAGAPGLVSAIDFHIAALHGVRFEGDQALEAGRRLLGDVRALGAIGQEAWAWILIGQAHAVSGHRVRAEAAGAEAIALASDNPEIIGTAVGICHGLPLLLEDDADAASERLRRSVEELRRLPAIGAIPPWYLWPVLATVRDLEGDGGVAARRETQSADLRIAPGPDALWHLAQAVALGRDGDRSGSQEHAAAAAERFLAVPGFAGWRHLGHRWVAEDATAAGWGEPDRWMLEAESFFAERGFFHLATRCRGLARNAGAPQRRRRGATTVPEHLRILGVTGREIDVLRLVAEGLTNAEIADRLVLSPRTVKGYVEQLLAKTGATNRTQVAQHLLP